VDDPVDIELGCSRDHQVPLMAGDEVAVDGELHGGGAVRLPVHSIHPGWGYSSSSSSSADCCLTLDNTHKTENRHVLVDCFNIV